MSESRFAVFAYGSLVAPASAEMTLGRPVTEAVPAVLEGWRRRFSAARENRTVEKTFATAEGTIPDVVLGLNVEPGTGAEEPPNGMLLPVSEDELERLDRRELRYDRADVTEAVAGDGIARFERVVTYTAKRGHHAPAAPEGAVIIAAYAKAVEAAFAALGGEQAERYRRTTLPYPAPLIEAVLVHDRIPPGNPRAW